MVSGQNVIKAIKLTFERKINFMIAINFLYTNEFGDTTTFSKEYTESDAILLDRSEFEFLVDEFKRFLCASGFASETINKLQIIDSPTDE